jgi:prolipoprotein diacylglyceryltransferase
MLFWTWLGLYSLGRFFIEQLRVDPAHEWGPWRLNAWVALGFFVLGVAAFVWIQTVRPRRRRRAEAPKKPPPAMAIPKGRVRG